VEVTADFVPPTAGSGGLLGMTNGDGDSSRVFGTLFLIILLGFGLAGSCLRRVV
jgi:hypothetical protein